MKRKFVFTILLFSFLIFLVSCNNATKYFDEGNYTKTLEALNNKKGLSKNDYLMKIKSYVNLGRTDESKESVMLYLLMADDSDERGYAIDLYTEMNFSDVLNILILKDSDGLKAQILKYKSYIKLGKYDEAKDLLSTYIASELSIEDFAKLLVVYPFDNEYTYSFFNAWFNTLKNQEKTTFYSLFFYYARTDISIELARKCLDLSNKFDSDKFFIESKTNRALLLKIKGYLCEKFNDSNNARNYWLESYKLNPNDTEVKDKLR